MHSDIEITREIPAEGTEIGPKEGRITVLVLAVDYMKGKGIVASVSVEGREASRLGMARTLNIFGFGNERVLIDAHSRKRPKLLRDIGARLQQHGEAILDEMDGWAQKAGPWTEQRQKDYMRHRLATYLNGEAKPDGRPCRRFWTTDAAAIAAE